MKMFKIHFQVEEEKVGSVLALLHETLGRDVEVGYEIVEPMSYLKNRPRKGKAGNGHKPVKRGKKVGLFLEHFKPNGVYDYDRVKQFYKNSGFVTMGNLSTLVKQLVANKKLAKDGNSYKRGTE